MPTIAEIRQQYPQYQDMSDQQLADALHSKFYSDLPQDDFYKRIGFSGQQQQPSRDGVMGKIDAAMRGAADTLSFGLADEIAAGGDALLNPILGTGQDGGSLSERYNRNLEQQRGIDASDAKDRFGYRLGGQLAGGVTGGAGLVKAGLSPTAAAINAGYRLPAVSLASGLEGAALGAAQGFGSGEGVEGRLKGAGSSGAWGFGLGAATPYLVSGASAAYRKARTPFQASPELSNAARYLESEGIPLTAGQKTGSDGLRFAESELGGAKARKIMEEQAEAFTDAAMRRAGASGRATSDNMTELAQRLGQGFEGISARNVLRADPQLGQDIGKTLNRYEKLLETQQKPIIADITDDIMERLQANGGTIPGPDYQMIRSDLSKAAKSASNENLGNAFRGLRDALDGAMERSINPQDAGAWSQLRRQYGNMRVLERAANGGGEDAAMGLISPARLRMAAASGNQGGYARGQGDFAQLAKAGQAAMTPMPNSGTSSRLAVRGLMNLPAAAGAIAGGASGDVATGLLGMLAGAAVPKIAGKGLMSGPMQQYLANQAVTGSASPEIRGLMNIILNMEAGSAAGRLASP